ncbi:hypothetical protein Q5P01_013400 [Channa striata]|uniref:BRCT domain-containing protein n=1 Tax=Channa striata TaxID=64152 RepID=A0AA88MMN5_CHASR|nr:hypothetical protein Q5P01_013400 [Channa striata]
MDHGDPVQNKDWRNTKDAVANFRRLLLCSKCTSLMKEPVCLGMCEHMLCRSCAGPRAGDGCIVCHSPAWVKDIQINRQLSSIIQLFSGLESLLNPVEQPDSSVTGVETQLSLNKRRTLRSGSALAAVRCNNESRNRKNRSTKKNAVRNKTVVQGTSRTTRKQTKKKRLEDINQQWGITEVLEQPCAEGEKRSSKRVSFVSPDVTSEEPQPKVPQGSTNEPLSGTTSVIHSEGCDTDIYHQASPGQNMQVSVVQKDMQCANDLSPTDNPNKQDNVSPAKHSSKRTRGEDKVCTLETTPKRPRNSPGRRIKSRGRMSPAVLNPPSVTSPRCSESTNSSREEQGASCVRKSPCIHSASVGRPSSGSPAVMKRNHKGETLLHLAAIKGDVEAVKELLDQGADPNLKDNAGWTPLHEACNLGHLEVVQLLVTEGALLNTPGYENDSPLHDAVRNGHVAIVKLLLQLGASQNVLNQYGKRPADYALSVEMLEIFQEVSDGNQYANTSFSPSANLSVVGNCVRRDEMVVFLATKLSQPQQRQLAKLGQLLGGRVAHTFSGSVSHVVVPEGHMPTTNSTLLGLLAGCWIVRYSWVEACLQAGKRMPETEHEAGEGPQRSRINRCSLLPPLFDGCFFFLLGSFKAPTKEELTKLLREGGGQLLSRQPKPDSDVTQTLSAAAYHALPGSDQALCTQYIIFDPQGPHKPNVVRRGKVWSAPSSWLIDCITAFQLLPVPEPQVSN